MRKEPKFLFPVHPGDLLMFDSNACSWTVMFIVAASCPTTHEQDMHSYATQECMVMTNDRLVSKYYIYDGDGYDFNITTVARVS